MADRPHHRREFLRTAGAAGLTTAVLGLAPKRAAGLEVSASGGAFGEDSDLSAPRGLSPRDWAADPSFPRQELAAVREIVGVSHTQLDRAQELVSARPALANASWDWGFGDWESAIGAASHMGRADIAQMLMDHGARPDLFTLVMLGRLDSVQAVVSSQPGIQRTLGPHGITLLQHARNRLARDDVSSRDQANVRQVLEYLESVGGADERETSLPVTEAETEVYLGEYAMEGGGDVLTVALSPRGALSLVVGEGVSRVLNRVEEHGFAPGGAPAVRVRFRVVDGRAEALTVHDPVPIATAVRV